MSILTDCLNRILNWLEQNEPSFARALQPGLSESQIRDRVEYGFPLSLPTEFYELYQWRNGTIFGEEEFVIFVPGYAFNSLEYAIDQYQDFIEDAEDFAERNDCDPSDIWRHDLLPIFSCDLIQDYICIVGNQELQKTSPMTYFWGEDKETGVIYSSLTSMMQTVAECYETGAYYLSKDGDIETDESMQKQIYHKYN